jgi:hypothetical protein
MSARSLAIKARRAAPAAAAGLLLLGVWAPPATVEARSSTTVLERRVKAAFLYKFAGYVEWPTHAFPRPDTPVTIGVAGDERLADELALLVQGRTSGNRRVAVDRLDQGEDLDGVHILFVAQSEGARLAQWIRAARSLPILVVTERDRGLDEGSMINFIMDEGRVRFEIAIGPATRSGLQLNSGLLAVAKAVTSGNQ